MGFRQQRTSALRRNRTLPRGAPYAEMPWQVVSWGTNDVEITVWQPGSVVEAVGDEVTLSGIPAMRLMLTNELPTNAIWLPPLLTLIYASPLPVGSQLLLPGNDPALRDNFGSVLSGGLVDRAPEPPVPTDIAATAATSVYPLMEITLDSALLFGNGVANIYNTTAGEAAVTTIVSGGTLFVAFPSGGAPGDVIDFAAVADPALRTPNGGYLLPFSLVAA